MSDSFVVTGGNRLEGIVRVGGAKNAALPMLCGALLTDQPCTFHDVPEITDVALLLGIFEELGASVTWDKPSRTVTVVAKDIHPERLPGCEQAKKMRASILLVGPLLARFGRVVLPQPGGCVIGARPNDTHYQGFEALGATVTVREEEIEITHPLTGFGATDVWLREASVTATENLALFAAGIPAETTLTFSATETHVAATASMLAHMGATVAGQGTYRMNIAGVQPLQGGTFTIPSDGLLVATYALAGILTGGHLRIENADHTELLPFYRALRHCGVHFTLHENAVLEVFGDAELHSPGRLQTTIAPGFPTDLQSPFGVLLTQIPGEHRIFETMFENRLGYLLELEKMGARVEILNAHEARIMGGRTLKGAEVQSWDLRAGAAMVLAGLCARGQTTISNIVYIDRGYEHFEAVLQSLGADIQRVKG